MNSLLISSLFIPSKTREHAEAVALKALWIDAVAIECAVAWPTPMACAAFLAPIEVKATIRLRTAGTRAWALFVTASRLGM